MTTAPPVEYAIARRYLDLRRQGTAGRSHAAIERRGACQALRELATELGYAPRFSKVEVPGPGPGALHEAAMELAAHLGRRR